MVWSDPEYVYRMGDERLEISPTVRDLGVLLKTRGNESTVYFRS